MSLSHQMQVTIGKAIGALRHPRKPLPSDTQARQELREHCERHEPLTTDGLTGAALAWAENNNEFRRECIESDPGEFTRWPVVRKTMYVDASPYLRTEYEALRGRPDFQTRWLPGITESWVGSPKRFWLDGRTSGNRVHMAYHLARYMDATGIDPTQYDAVLEFGGGYGCMCDTMHRLGFKGRYVIVDLPIQSGLQGYFLKQNGRQIVGPDASGDGVTLVCDQDLLKQAVGQLTGERLFLATWSLSESPITVREPIESLIQGFEGCLIAYQEQFEQIDNVDYFGKWRQRWPGLNPQDQLVGDHLKHNHYVFGASTALAPDTPDTTDS